MYPSYYMVGQAFLLVFGLWWCKEVLGRFGKDLAELLGKGDFTTKGIILFFWLLTVGVAMMIWRMLYGILQPIFDLLW